LAFLFSSIVRGEGTRESDSLQFEAWESILPSFISKQILVSLSDDAQILTE